ncbi:MAG TPA: phosphopantothenoylcysteine decarboxylase [Candidatus Limnocylindria bacterium]|nr:phosphopantothenoylcysteine decarboxylase [Candidatus Limnocylindria bacterium]
MRLLITFGAGYEPIDQARRLTNFSTGRLGTYLANAFFTAGWDVHCLRSENTSFTGKLNAAEVEPFTTNDDLAERLERIGCLGRVDAVFHAAALCDFRVARVTDASGNAIHSPKIASRDGRLLLELEPATKVLPKLREWFPESRIVGWKYELAGTRQDAFGKAWRQLDECHTDACVLNGAAYGPGFSVCLPSRASFPCGDEASLAGHLLNWASQENNCRPQNMPLAA